MLHMQYIEGQISDCQRSVGFECDRSVSCVTARTRHAMDVFERADVSHMCRRRVAFVITRVRTARRYTAIQSGTVSAHTINPLLSPTSISPSLSEHFGLRSS